MVLCSPKYKANPGKYDDTVIRNEDGKGGDGKRYIKTHCSDCDSYPLENGTKECSKM
jgi:hypothetical protein